MGIAARDLPGRLHLGSLGVLLHGFGSQPLFPERVRTLYQSKDFSFAPIPFSAHTHAAIGSQMQLK